MRTYILFQLHKYFCNVEQACKTIICVIRYFHVYSQRLEALRERIASNVRKELGDQAEIKRLSDLDNIQDGKNVVVIGTLFKTQILKPNILKEVGEENAITNEEVAEKPILDKHIDSTDELVLEDELQRARLHFTNTDTDLKVFYFVRYHFYECTNYYLSSYHIFS